MHQHQYGGYCHNCQTSHHLQSQPAVDAASALMAELDANKSLIKNKPQFTTNPLFATARGQMFGVMLARDHTGKTQTLKAFSGQFNGQYMVEGWVPPVFNVEDFHALNRPEEKKIKALSLQISQTEDTSLTRTLKQERRDRSRTLMQKIHALYRLRNFHGEERDMAVFFPQGKGMPTGAGDCCAPKLIHQAIQHNLTPLGLAEFYFGLENKSQTRQHGHFYSSCTSNCAPILGFMLCGLETKRRYRI